MMISLLSNNQDLNMILINLLSNKILIRFLICLYFNYNKSILFALKIKIVDIQQLLIKFKELK